MKPSIKDLEAEIEDAVSVFEDLEQRVHTFFSLVDTGEWGNNWSVQNKGHRYRRETLSLYSDWREGTEPLVRRYCVERDIDRFDRAEVEFRELLSLQETKSSLTDTYQRTLDVLHIQKSIVEAIPNRIRSERLVSPQHQSKRLLNEELRESKRLLDRGVDRAAGVLAGVALERHLIVMGDSPSEDVSVSNRDGIASLAQTLRDGKVIEESERKQLVYLSEIRNKCAHADGEDPTHDEVSRLVEQVDDFIDRHS